MMYEKLSEERKRLQEQDLLPHFYITGGYQMFKEKYMWEAETPRDQYERIAKTLAGYTHDPDHFYEWFFKLLWKGWLSPSTPVLSNVGTKRGLPVSCGGSDVEDSIHGIFKSRMEAALLTKEGFGTSSFIGNVRCRGSEISTGATASGILDIIQNDARDMSYVTQGTARRGAKANYIPISHGDFHEVIDYLAEKPDGLNIGWNVYDEDIDKLFEGDPDMSERFAKAMHTKLKTGRGYFFFPDKVNRRLPAWCKEHGLEVKASNLCSEITLHASNSANSPDGSDGYDFVCVLSSMNISMYDEWKDTDAVYYATIFLDCVNEHFIDRGQHVKGIEKSVNFAKKGRALGLGQTGLHTYFISKGIAFSSKEAHELNIEIAKHINDESWRASKDMAGWWGEPDWCKGHGIRNTHTTAIAPTKSTALIMGGISEGISMIPGWTYVQGTAAGDVVRILPQLYELFAKYGKTDDEIKELIEQVKEAYGSVQGIDFLSEQDKLVHRTAFEESQFTVLRLAEERGKYLSQWQSLNLTFTAGDSEDYILNCHQYAFESENILGLYYVNVNTRIDTGLDDMECEACQ